MRCATAMYHYNQEGHASSGLEKDILYVLAIYFDANSYVCHIGRHLELQEPLSSRQCLNAYLKTVHLFLRLLITGLMQNEILDSNFFS